MNTWSIFYETKQRSTYRGHSQSLVLALTARLHTLLVGTPRHGYLCRNSVRQPTGNRDEHVIQGAGHSIKCMCNPRQQYQPPNSGRGMLVVGVVGGSIITICPLPRPVASSPSGA